MPRSNTAIGMPRRGLVRRPAVGRIGRRRCSPRRRTGCPLRRPGCPGRSRRPPRPGAGLVYVKPSFSPSSDLAHEACTGRSPRRRPGCTRSSCVNSAWWPLPSGGSKSRCRSPPRAKSESPMYCRFGGILDVERDVTRVPVGHEHVCRPPISLTTMSCWLGVRCGAVRPGLLDRVNSSSSSNSSTGTAARGLEMSKMSMSCGCAPCCPRTLGSLAPVRHMNTEWYSLANGRVAPPARWPCSRRAIDRARRVTPRRNARAASGWRGYSRPTGQSRRPTRRLGGRGLPQQVSLLTASTSRPSRNMITCAPSPW